MLTGTWTWLAGHDELSLGFHKSMRFTKARRTWPEERFGTWIQDKQLIQRCNIRSTLLGFMVPQISLKRKVSRTWQPKGIFKAPAKGTPKDPRIFLRSLSLSSDAMLGCRARFLGRQKDVAHAHLTWYKHWGPLFGVSLGGTRRHQGPKWGILFTTHMWPQNTGQPLEATVVSEENG